jgi:hypothetical protein
LLAALALQLAFTDLNSTAKGHVTFHDAANDQIAALDLTANQIQTYDIAGGAANPFTGDPITYLLASNGSGTAAAELKLAIAQDSTP